MSVFIIFSKCDSGVCELLRKMDAMKPGSKISGLCLAVPLMLALLDTALGKTRAAIRYAFSEFSESLSHRWVKIGIEDRQHDKEFFIYDSREKGIWILGEQGPERVHFGEEGEPANVSGMAVGQCGKIYLLLDWPIPTTVY